MKKAGAEFLGNERLLPLLIRLSIPSVIAMLVMALYNVVDTIFIGRGAGALGIAGLAIAFPIQLTIGALGHMVGIGAASIVSRKLGEGNQAAAEAALGTSLSFSLSFSLLLTVLMAFWAEPLLRVFGATDAILPYAHDYIRFLLIGFPLQTVAMAGNSLIRAEGNARMAMLSMLSGILLNLILDPVFIFGLDMGIKGAAIATVLGQVCVFVWVLWYYLKGWSVVALRARNLVIRLNLLREVLVLGLPNFVQMAGMSLITMMINNLLGYYAGDIAISAYGVIMRLVSFILMPLNGLAQGFQPIAGYNYGARNLDRVRGVLLLAQALATGVALFFYGFIMVFPDTLVGFFSTDTALIAFTVPALRTVALLTPVIGVQMISSIYFQAVGKGAQALLLGLSRQFIVLLPLILVFSRLYGARGIWVSFPVSDLLATVISVSALFFELRRLGNQAKESPERISGERVCNQP